MRMLFCDRCGRRVDFGYKLGENISTSYENMHTKKSVPYHICILQDSSYCDVGILCKQCSYEMLDNAIDALNEVELKKGKKK